MSTTKTWQLREMSRDELVQRYRELNEEHFNLRVQTAVSPMKNPKRIREIRREIARMKEIIVEKLGVSNDQVKPEAHFVDDLGADSLDQVELVMAFEEEFDIEIPDTDAEKIGSVSAAVKYIEDKQKA